MSHNYLFCLFKNYPVKLLFPTKKGKDVSWEFRYFKEFKYRNLFTVFSQPFVKYWLSINQTHSSVVWAFSVQNIELVGSWPRYPQDRNKLPLPLFYVSLFLWFIWRSSIELGLLVSPGVPWGRENEPFRKKINNQYFLLPFRRKHRHRLKVKNVPWRESRNNMFVKISSNFSNLWKLLLNFVF